MNTYDYKTVPNFTGLSAIGLAVCSCGLSVSFGLTLGHTGPLKLMFGLMLLSLAITEFVAAHYLANAWHSKQLIKIVLAGFLLLFGVVVSVLCGQATLQQSLDAAQQARRLQSDVYQAAVAQRQIAAEKVAALSVDETQALAAKKALTALSATKQAYLASPATNSRGKGAGTIAARVGDCTGTSYYVRKYCGQIRRLDSQLSEAKLTVDRWHEYKNAKAHLEELQSKPLPTGAKDEQLPGIAALAKILGTEGEQVGAVIFLIFSVFSELAAIILFFFLGSDSPQQADDIVPTTQPYIIQQPELQSQVQVPTLEESRRQNQAQPLTTLAESRRQNQVQPVTTQKESRHQNQVQPVTARKESRRQNQVQPVTTLPPSRRQNAPVADVPSVYQQVVDDIHANNLRNCSFRTLMSTYGVNQSQAAAIRLKLVADGKAKFTRRHELDLL
jgi:hypothetical protein